MAQKLRGTLTYVIKVLCCFVHYCRLSLFRGGGEGGGGVRQTCPLLGTPGRVSIQTLKSYYEVVSYFILSFLL